MNFLTSLFTKNTLNHEIRSLFIKFKIISELRVIIYEIIKALHVVCSGYKFCTTDRGLHFLGNWFKNKVPHHPAPHCEAFFYAFKNKDLTKSNDK